jgi:hypothetical protein
MIPMTAVLPNKVKAGLKALEMQLFTPIIVIYGVLILVT